MSELQEKLINNYLYQKEKILKRFKAKTQMDESRVRIFIGPVMDKTATIIRDWDVSPELLMEAVFSYSASKRHSGGPMNNMLTSAKFLGDALRYHLDIPYEVLSDKKSIDVYHELRDESYAAFLKEVENLDIDISLATSYPVEHLYLLAVARMDVRSMREMTPQLLELIGDDRKAESWLLKRGINYKSIARLFNNWKDTNYA